LFLTPFTSQRLCPVTQATREVPSLCLSLEWSNRHPAINDLSLVTSYSDGHVAVWNLQDDRLQPTYDFPAHSLEAWIAAFNCWQSAVVWSGADDCTLKGWDLRVGTEVPLFSKRHDMGVTSIQFNDRDQHKVAVGCYDEYISLWDARSMARPYARGHTEGGGVWRVKWAHHDTEEYVVTACMHAGFQIWKLENNSLSRAFTRTSPHTSLAYGVDWTHDGDNNLIVACASFYDHLISLWSPLLQHENIP